jgi:SH3-like domain-containing protein
MSAAQIPTITPTPPPSASPSPVPTLTATPRATEAAADTQVAVVRQYSVNVHIEPDVKSEVTGYVYADDVVTILECQPDGDYCKIEQPFGWVYRGCLAGFEDGRGCEAVK